MDSYRQIERVVEKDDINEIVKNYAAATGEIKKHYEMAIQTFIAIGRSRGAELEIFFPEFKGANPKYSFPELAPNTETL